MSQLILPDGTNLLLTRGQQVGQVSDGYHTFDQLYEHRTLLFCTLMNQLKDISWHSKFHNDGSTYENWFIAGMELPSGTITYHLPGYLKPYLSQIKELPKAPPWDGHKAEDVVKRLENYLETLNN